ncbi:MAG: putative permease [Sulfurimonas sp.]|jgi:predicted permease
MENFLLIFVAIMAGYLINRGNVFPKDTPMILNQFILYLSLPAMALLEIPKMDLSFEILIPIIVAWIVMGISAIVIFSISKMLNFSKNITGSLLLVGVLGNTSFVGIPINHAYFGTYSLPYVLVYDLLGSFIMLSTYGTFISAYYSSAEDVDTKVIIKKMITFPPFISLLLALLFIGTEFPPMITNVLSVFSSTIVPLALVAVGFQLKFKLPKEDIKPFFAGLSVKLILSPIIAIIIIYAFSWDNKVALISIIESGMGPMISAAAVASMAGLAPRLSSAMVGYGILFSFFTTWILFQVIS